MPDKLPTQAVTEITAERTLGGSSRPRVCISIELRIHAEGLECPQRAHCPVGSVADLLVVCVMPDATFLAAAVGVGLSPLHAVVAALGEGRFRRLFGAVFVLS